MQLTPLKLSLAELAALPFRPPPDAGKLWWGVPHAELADAILDAARVRLWTIGDAPAFVSRDGRDLLLTVALERAGVKRALAVQASHGRRRAAKAYLGVADEGRGCVAWLECWPFGMPGRPNLIAGTSAADAANAALVWFDKASGQAGKTVDRLKGRTLGESQVRELLFAAARGHQGSRSLPWSRVGMVDRQLGGERPATAWELLLAVAEAARLNPPLLAPEQVYKFRLLLDEGK